MPMFWHLFDTIINWHQLKKSSSVHYSKKKYRKMREAMGAFIMPN